MTIDVTIDIVARAICAISTTRTEALPKGAKDSFDILPVSFKGEYRKKAQAFLESLAENNASVVVQSDIK